MKEKKAIKTTRIFSIVICILLFTLLGGIGLHTGYTEWKKTALTKYMEQLRENAERENRIEHITVAVIDSGYNEEEQFEHRISDKAWNFLENTKDVSDEYGHGSQITSLILNNTPNSVSIMSLKVMDKAGIAKVEDVSKALRYAMENGADIISLSMNSMLYQEENQLSDLIDEITQAGIQVIVSAGNDGENVKNLFPANVESAFVIGAANRDYTIAEFSNYGETVDFCAYGKFNGERGTSFAAAYVTSIVAEMKTYGEEDVENIFCKYAVSYHTPNGTGEKSDGVSSNKTKSDGVNSNRTKSDRANSKGVKSDGAKGDRVKNNGTKSNRENSNEEDSSKGNSCDWGKGYLWVDYAITETEEPKETEQTEGTLYLGGITRTEYDLGADICQLDWQNIDGEILNEYLGATRKEYVGMLLKSLSEEERIQLTKKCSILESNVEQTHFEYDTEANAYLPVEKVSYEFSKYCIAQYEEKKGRMAVSAWTVADEKAVFYISDEPQTGSYRYELYGMQGGEATDVNKNLAISPPNAFNLTVEKIVIKQNKNFNPEIDSLYTYITDVTARYIRYTFLNKWEPQIEYSISMQNPDILYFDKINPNHNRLNGGDNGSVFYGLSIYFSNTYTGMQGYHYEPKTQAYIYNTDAPAYSYNYTTLTDDGFVFTTDKDKAWKEPLANNFNALSIPLDAHIFVGKEQDSYKINPLKVDSYQEAKKYYEITKLSHSAYLQTDFPSYNNNDGTMVMNSPLYGMSSLRYYDTEEDKLAISNDVAEYVMVMSPNSYTITANADGGEVNDYPNNAGMQSTSCFTVRYHSTDFDNIGGLVPQREGYVFEGWYTGRNGTGEQVWDKNGRANIQTSSYWNTTGKWTYLNSLTVYANWLPCTSVTLDANYGTLVDYRTGVTVNTTTIQTIQNSTNYNNIAWATPTREGYLFAGWYTKRNGGEEIWDITGQAVTSCTYWNPSKKWKGTEASATFYAHWVSISYVQLDANWGTITDYIQGNGDTNITGFYTEYGQNYYDNISKLSPKREGFTFLGWYVDPDDPNNFSGNDVGRNGGVPVWDVNGKAINGSEFWKDGKWSYADGNVVAFARWRGENEPETYSAYFNANGGKLYDYIQTSKWTTTTYCYTEIGKNYYDNVTQLTPKRDGYTFLGWYSKQRGGVKVYHANGSVTNEGTYFKNNFWQYQGNPTFYAQWKANTYTIQFDGNGGTGKKPSMTGLEYGKEYVLSENSPITNGFERSGYSFLGWNTKKDGTGTSYHDGADILHTPITNATTLILYAQWSANSYNVKFDANGGTGSKPSIMGLNYGKTYILSANSPLTDGFSKAGYYFNGWNTKADGSGKAYGNKASICNLTTTNGETMILYAQWKANTYYINFSGNGSTSGSMTKMTCSYGAVHPLTANKFSKKSYVFDGWNTKADGSGKSYEDKANIKNLTTTNGATITLYAQWKDKTPPSIQNENTEELHPSSTARKIIYGWTNQEVALKFTASDKESGMRSLILYEGHGTTGIILRNSVKDVEYLVAEEGIHEYTVVATDKMGNTATIYITAKIDYVTPQGELAVDYDGYQLSVAVKNIVEECKGNKASGCKEAWIIIKGLDGGGNVLYEERKELLLQTSDNIYTGAAYLGTFELSDVFNYESDYLQIDAYVKDCANNYLPSIGTHTLPTFVVTGYVERCLGAAEEWTSGEAGNVQVYTASFVDTIYIEYPSEWINLDDTLKNHIYDYRGTQTKDKSETDLFYIPLYADNGEYHIIVHAYKNGHEKEISLPVLTDGSILDEIRTRLR